MEKSIFQVVVVKDDKIIADYKMLAVNEDKAREKVAVKNADLIKEVDIYIRPF